ncbi:MAG: ATPase, P-type (transporting), superfamily, subfamily [Chitinophagaceae bacterium]|nr:ATPase, P-type (transporting), superfamily, subfamily [Chitinophagaceae bacterium]
MAEATTIGLNDVQVIKSRALYGANIFEQEHPEHFWTVFKKAITEPMFMLLIAACVLYFLLGQYMEGLIMLVAMLFVASISFFQERRNSKALSAVKKMNQPKVKVMRNGRTTIIPSEELVVGDTLLIEEGEQISADGLLLNAHDFSVDESILTGESFAVVKSQSSDHKEVYLGSIVQTGNATVKVTQVGLQTLMGKLGRSIEQIKPSPNRFQKEIESLVKIMAKVGFAAFFLVLVVYYVRTGNWMHAIIFALTMAMSVLPEEIPVAFSTFLTLGSRRLLKQQVLVKDPQVLETLGSATVVCMDKTGTITENRMKVDAIFSWSDRLRSTLSQLTPSGLQTITYAMWASEPQPFDPMEKAIHEAYQQQLAHDERMNYSMVHEYPLSGTPPSMTHVYENKEGKRIVACKGGPETIIQFCKLTDEEAQVMLATARLMASEGYRVLGVASATFTEQSEFPLAQKDFNWQCEGLIGLYDPPKENMREVLSDFYKAGIQVKILSGDYPETNQAVAKKIQLKGVDQVLTGSDVMKMTDEVLKVEVNQKSIFARMFPEAKWKVVNALKSNGETVVMMGDGVNDGLAIKAADFGVAMGSKGTETAKQAASLVLLDNDLAHLFGAIMHGRKIKVNLKKAIRYILSIHIPIVLLVAVPLLLGWPFMAVFLPVHVIFLELIMGPTCSVIYENEPIEPSMYTVQDRAVVSHFLSRREFLISMVQGLVIAFCVLCFYYVLMQKGYAEMEIRAMVFTTIVCANVFLTLENRSFTASLFQTFQYKNRGMYLMIGLSLLLLLITLYVPGVRSVFAMNALSIKEFAVCLSIGWLSVIWMEGYKLFGMRYFRDKININ